MCVVQAYITAIFNYNRKRFLEQVPKTLKILPYQVWALPDVDILSQRERPVSSTNLWKATTRVGKFDVD
jgi:hypothetical protein